MVLPCQIWNIGRMWNFLAGFGTLKETVVEAMRMDETSKEEIVDKGEKENHGLEFW